jgi:hypothetical protein
MRSKLRFLLILKESIMQNLIININFTHFGLHSFPHLLFECFILIICLISNFCNTSLFNEIRKFKWCFVNTSFILKISSLLAPVSRNRHGITNHFHVHQKLRVFCSDIPCFNHIRSSDLHLQIKHFHATQQLLLLL